MLAPSLLFICYLYSLTMSQWWCLMGDDSTSTTATHHVTTERKAGAGHLKKIYGSRYEEVHGLATEANHRFNDNWIFRRI